MVQNQIEISEGANQIKIFQINLTVFFASLHLSLIIGSHTGEFRVASRRKILRGPEEKSRGVLMFSHNFEFYD